MTSKISSVLHEAMTVGLDETLNSVMMKLRWRKYSSILVMSEDESIFGILNQRDINLARKHKLNFKATHAWEVCSQGIKTIAQDVPWLKPGS